MRSIPAAIGALALLLLSGIAACRAPAGAPAQPPPPPAAPPGRFVAELGGIGRREQDVLRSLEYVALSSGLARTEALPPEWETRDEVIDLVVDRAFAAALLDAEITRRGIVPAPQALDVAWAGNEHLAAIAALSPPLRDEALARFHHLRFADVEREVARSAAYPGWLEARAAELGDEPARAEWARARDVATVDLHIIDDPVPAERIDALVRDETERLDAWFRDKAGRYRQPRRARLLAIERPLPPESDGPARAEALQALEGLREQALARGIEPVAADLAEGSGVPAPRWVSGRSWGPAFTAGAGSMTRVVAGADRAWFAWVYETVEAGVPPLDDDMRRTVARDMLRHEHVGAEAVARAEALLRALRAGEEPAITWQRTPPFARTDNGSVPIVGEEPALSAAIFEHLLDPGDLVAAPVPLRDAVAIARLVERRRPQPGQWELEREEWIALWLAAVRPSLWPDYYAAWARDRVRRVSYARLREALAAWTDASEGSR